MMDKNDGLRQVQEMFKTIDPDVVELVFIECQQKVDASVIQLSVIAEGTTDVHSTNIGSNNKDIKQQTTAVKNDNILTEIMSDGTSIEESSDSVFKLIQKTDPITRTWQHNTTPLLQCVSDSGHNVDNKEIMRNDVKQCSNKNHSFRAPLRPPVQLQYIRQSVRPETRPIYHHGTYQPYPMPQPHLRVPTMGLLPLPQRTFWRGQQNMQNPRPVFRHQVRHPFSEKQQTSVGKNLHPKEGGKSPSQKLLFILRGLPGSGKSTLARTLVRGGGVIISTDDYFIENDRYVFNPGGLQSAHEWNQDRARKFMRNGITPVVIDNTNTRTWEMKPYVSIGLRFGYDVRIKEPETPWKWNLKELSRRNQHGVSVKSLRNMLERYERNVTVESIIKSNQKEDSVDGQTTSNKNNQNLSGKSVLDVANRDCAEKVKKSNPRNDVRNTETKMNIDGKNVVSEKDLKQSTTCDKIEYEQVLPRIVSERDKLDPKRIESSESPKAKANSTEISHVTKTSIAIDDLFNLEPYKANDNSVLKNERGDKNMDRISMIDLSDSSFPQANNNTDVSDVSIQQALTIGSSNHEVSHLTADDDMAILETVHNKPSPKVDKKLTGVFSKTDETPETFDMSPIHKIMNDDVKIHQKIIDLEKVDVDDKLSGKTIAGTTEVSSETSDSSDNIEFLRNCFSQIDIELVQFYLARCGGNLLRTVDCLLTYDVNGVLLPTKIKKNLETEGMSSSSFTKTAATSTTAAAVTTTVTSPVQDIRPCSKPIELDAELDEPEVEEISEDPGTSSNTFKDLSLSSLHLTLDPALALQLLEIFGSFNGVSAADSLAENMLSVEIDQEFAKHLYKKWRRTVQKKRKNPDDQKTLKNPLSSPATPGNNVKRAKFKTPPSGFGSATENDMTMSPKNNMQKDSTSLKKKMDGELAIHDSKSEEIWKEENMDLCTRLKRSRLHGIFPTVDKLSLNEVFEANNFCLDKTVEQVQSSIGEEKPSFHMQTDTKQKSFVKGAISETKPPPSPHDMETSGCYQSLEKPEYKDFRAEANTHYKLREECIKKAALAYSKKQGQLAMVYAQQAKAHGEQIKEANRRAAENIATTRNINLKTTNELDLHELHVDEALEILESVLAERENELRRPKRKYPSFIDVITGRGSHSRRGKARIKPAVLEYVKRNKHRFRVEELNPGLYRVFLL